MYSPCPSAVHFSFRRSLIVCNHPIQDFLIVGSRYTVITALSVSMLARRKINSVCKCTGSFVKDENDTIETSNNISSAML